MADCPLHLDFVFSCRPASTTCVPLTACRLQGLAPDIGKFETVSYSARNVFCRESQAGMPPVELEESSRQGFLGNPTHWWDTRCCRRNLRSPDLRRNIPNEPLRPNNPHEPGWVELELVSLDTGMKMAPKFLSSPAEGQGATERIGPHEALLPIRICRNLCETGLISEAVDALNLRVQQGYHVDNNLYYRVLKRCIAQNDLDVGRRIHALTIKSGYEGDTFLATHLISLYATQGRLEEALQVFNEVPIPTVYNWTTIIFAYARHGEAAQAMHLCRQMLLSTSTKPDNRLYVALLKACATAGDLAAGKEVHAHILAIQGKPDIFVQAGLVDMYAKCGSLGDARMVFDRLPERNMVTWTALIAGYARHGMGQEALSLHYRMQREGFNPPDSVMYVCLLQACASVGSGAVEQGKQLHAQLESQGLHEDLVLGGSLVNMYAKCGSLGDARMVFDRLPQRNVVTWNALLAGYAQQGMAEEVVSLYSRMQQEGSTAPDSVTFVCLLQACANLGVKTMDLGMKLHAEIEERGLLVGLVLGGSLVNMYAKCGSLGEARRVFDGLPDRDVVTWNALLAGYVEQGRGQEALSLYSWMQQDSLTAPNRVTYVCVLQACAFVAALPLGQQLHAQIEERGLQSDVAVGAGLINMYAKCGSMLDSQVVFDALPKKSIEAWNALTGGYARQGDSAVVFDLVMRMRLEGIRPDAVTFLFLLTVCSHVGQVDKGCQYFEAMKLEHGIDPSIEHYTCMVDLVGRAGHLDEALRMAKTMPFLPDITVWLTLLGACQKWKSVEIGQQAFEFAVTEDVQNAASYVLMSNIYASVEMWEEAKEMQARKVQSGAWRKPGQSWWTDMGGVVHTFVVADKTHREECKAG